MALPPEDAPLFPSEASLQPSAEAVADRPRLRLFRKRVPEVAPVTPRSAALFRFGEQCNYRCPMCSNTGERGLFFHPVEELCQRADFLQEHGFRRVVVTGGEATIHPGFWTVIEHLAARGMVWDTNTHGRTYARPGFAERAVATGLQRAIVSLHSHQPAVSAEIFGVDEAAHFGTVQGIERLLEVGVPVMVNCVLSRRNLPHVEDYVEWVARHFRKGVTLKVVFPSTIGKGGRWDAIAGLRYEDVRAPVQRMRERARESRLRLHFESFPNCILGDAEARPVGRSAFGESHYLDDANGRRVYSMRFIEAELSAHGEACRTCPALARCPGVARAYLRRFGVAEFVPLGNLRGPGSSSCPPRDRKPGQPVDRLARPS